MIKMKDYKKLAKQRELELEIVDLNRLREKLLDNLGELGVNLNQDKVVKGGRVDPETLEKELKLVRQLQEETDDKLLQQQVQDVLSQAREGSRYVRLERRLWEEPETVRHKRLESLQAEQLVYQQKQLEIFDFLEKHFAQFEVMNLTVTLPDAGKKFFSEVVAVVTQQMRELSKKGRELESLLEGKIKKLEKLQLREQRELERIHHEVGRNLTDNELGSPALVKKNQAYQKLLKEIKILTALKTSILNQVNVLVDMGIAQLAVLVKKLKSITGQNQVTRGLLYQLKMRNKSWQRESLKEEVEKLFSAFDAQVGAQLIEEIDRRYEDGELKEAARGNFCELVEEVLQFQEYLGQVMMDSYQVLVSNLDDLERARWEYGRLVLDFFSK